MFAGQKVLVAGGDRGTAPRKRVAVIGCGVAGLAALKTALEDGHDVIGFERQPDIGGLWNWRTFGSDKPYAEIKDPEVHCYPVYRTLMTNTTRYNTMFSDFMPLEGAAGDGHLKFMCADDVCDYAKAYADHFQLLTRIRLNAHVCKVDKQGKKWHVSYQTGNEIRTEIVDNVIITIGAFAYPRFDVEGSEEYKGLLVHSGQVRHGHLFKDKRVLIIGGAYSAGEMMNMALRNNVKKLYVSASRRPESKCAWTIDRHVKSIYGDIRPWDLLMTRDNGIDHAADFTEMMGYWCYAFHKTKPDAFLTYPGDSVGITCVDIVEKGRQDGVLEFVQPVTGFGPNEAIMRDGSKLADIDIVVCATGYDQKFPFLDHLWKREEQIECELYNYVVSPNPVLDGIGFVLMQPAGFSLLPSGEMQVRWFVNKIVSRPYNESGTIFSEEERKHMYDTIAAKHAERPPLFRFNYIDDVPLLMETLAIDMGVQPPDYKELIESGDEAKIELGVALLYGPYIGTQYRIQGPNAWSRAAQECIDLSKRFLGKHFDEYVEKVKNNVYPASGKVDPQKGPWNEYVGEKAYL